MNLPTTIVARYAGENPDSLARQKDYGQLDMVPSAGGLLVKKTYDWEVLAARWEKLPLEEKAAAISVPLLSQKQQALMVSSLPVVKRSAESLSKFLRLKKGAPDWLYEFQVSIDRDGAIEFAPVVPSSDPRKTVSLMEKLAEAGKFKSELLSRRSNGLPMVAVHLHLSFPNLKDKHRAARLLNEYKKLILVNLFSTESLFEKMFDPSEMNSYHAAPEGQGLYRLYSSNHFEIRELIDTPEKVIADFTRWMGMPTEEAIAEIHERINTQLEKKSEAWDKIVSRDEKTTLEFLPFLAPRYQRRALFATLEVNERTSEIELGERVLKLSPTTAVHWAGVLTPEVRKEVLAKLHPEVARLPREAVAAFLAALPPKLRREFLSAARPVPRLTFATRQTLHRCEKILSALLPHFVFGDK